MICCPNYQWLRPRPEEAVVPIQEPRPRGEEDLQSQDSNESRLLAELRGRGIHNHQNQEIILEANNSNLQDAETLLRLRRRMRRDRIVRRRIGQLQRESKFLNPDPHF